MRDPGRSPTSHVLGDGNLRVGRHAVEVSAASSSCRGSPRYRAARSSRGRRRARTRGARRRTALADSCASRAGPSDATLMREPRARREPAAGRPVRAIDRFRRRGAAGGMRIGRARIRRLNVPASLEASRAGMQDREAVQRADLRVRPIRRGPQGRRVGGKHIAQPDLLAHVRIVRAIIRARRGRR